MTQTEKTNLVSMAIKAAQNAYSPYSKFKVGAALFCEDKTVFCGCNVENSSYSATNCAERVAFQSAVAQGKRNFLAIAIAGGEQCIGEELIPPCGICRQVMAEFCDADSFIILLAKKDGFAEYKLKDLLPLSFSKENLK